MESNTSRVLFGFSGKILHINLSKKSINIEKINLEYSNKFLGGAGYACRYLYDFIEKKTDPLSPENILMIMNGPFTLTSAPSFGRFVICSKSPYTNLWGEANCGGSFGPELKKAGYDGIILTGKAEKPVYIKIIDDSIQILNASNLWGKGIKKTIKILKENAYNIKFKVLCIGQAGENKVKYANINAEGRSAGRTGMGAVMGSKNLKAITVKGNNFKPQIAYPKDFIKTAKKTLRFILNTNSAKVLRKMGTSAVVMKAYTSGDLPIKYWSKGTWKDIVEISGEKLNNKFLIRNKSCYGCAIGCGRIIELENTNHKMNECEGPEYETIAGFGSMILNRDLNSIAIANYLCNDYGLDTISTSSVIAFIYYLFNQNKVNSEYVDNLNLNWGNFDSMLKLIKKIAYREGLGDILAKGSNFVGQKFGISREEIATINNLEVPYHDLRYCYGMALTYAFSPRGACHTTADVFKVLNCTNEIDFSSLNIIKNKLDIDNEDMINATIKLQNYRSLYSSLISCFFSNPPPKFMAELIYYLTGIPFDVNKIQVMGERIFNLKRMFNIKMGLTAENDYIPNILLKPLKEGPITGKTPNFDQMRKTYYKIRNWDSISGKPTSSKLRSLDINIY